MFTLRGSHLVSLITSPAGRASLGDFVRAAAVRSLYREFLRQVRRAPPHARAELQQMVRDGFRRTTAGPQPYAFRMAHARQQLDGLRRMLDTAQVDRPRASE